MAGFRVARIARLRHLPAAATALLTVAAFGAPSGFAHGPSAPPVPHHYHVNIGALVLDQPHHRLVGLGPPDDLLTFDQTTHQLKHVLHAAKDELLSFAGVDTVNGHILQTAHRCGTIKQCLYPDPKRSRKLIPTLAKLVDDRSGAILNTIEVTRRPAFGFLGAVAVDEVDSGLHHGFVITLDGRGIMVGTQTGALLKRFHIPDPEWRFDLEQPSTNTIDSARHRLVVLISGPPCADNKPCPPPRYKFNVIDTTTGTVVQRVAYKEDLYTLAFDQTGHQIVTASLDALTAFRFSCCVAWHARKGFGFTDLVVDDQARRVFTTGLLTDFTSSRCLELEMHDAANGRLLRKQNVGGTYKQHNCGRLHLAVDRTTSQLFVGDDQRLRIDVFDSRSGLPIRTIRLHRNVAKEMVVDEQSHLLFVSGPGGLTVIPTTRS